MMPSEAHHLRMMTSLFQPVRCSPSVVLLWVRLSDRAVRAQEWSQHASGSPPRICRENIVFCFYRRVAWVAACGVVPERSKRVGRCIIVKLRVSPAAGVAESLGILLDERNRFQGVGHHHEIGGL